MGQHQDRMRFATVLRQVHRAGVQVPGGETEVVDVQVESSSRGC
jgi:hypothetical protein